MKRLEGQPSRSSMPRTDRGRWALFAALTARNVSWARLLGLGQRSTVVPHGVTMHRIEDLTMPVHKSSYSLDPRAAEYLKRRAKTLKRSASSVLSELVVEAAHMEARDRVLQELGPGGAIAERDVQRWLKKLGAA